MKPPAFQYFRPETISDALILLDSVPDAKILAGGQSLIPLMNMRLARPTALIDINHVPELTTIREDAHCLELGALVRHYQLKENPVIRRFSPLVAQAEEYIGHEAIRSRGTIGGSLAHADPAAELPLIAVLSDWEMVVQSPDEMRIIPAPDFFMSYFITALAPNEILTGVRIPRQTAHGSIREYSPRSGDFAIASAAVLVHSDPAGRLDTLRVALGGVADIPWRNPAMEQQWLGQSVSHELWVAIARRIAEEIDPPEDLHASREYRRHLAETLIIESLTDAMAHDLETA